MKIGFIGTGNIGAPIAGQLLKAGHRLLVHDLRRANAEKLLASGAGVSTNAKSSRPACPAPKKWKRSASVPPASSQT